MKTWARLEFFGHLTTCPKMLLEWENRGPSPADFEKKVAHKNFEVDFWPIFKNFFRENAENKILKKISKIF